MSRPSISSLILFSCLTLASCAVGPDFQTPDAPQTQSYTYSELPNRTVAATGQGGKSQRFALGKDIPAQWWHLFQCPSLNALIIQGLTNSPNLEAAQAALRQARENLNAEIGSAVFPAVDAGIGAQRNKSNGSSSGGPDNQSSIFNLYNTSVNVSYTLDLFGGLRRQIEALQSQMEFQHFELEASYLTLTANIVSTAINEASLRAQIQATHALIDLQKKQLDIVKSQFALGSASQADILAQSTLLAQTRATLPPLENNLAQSRHALAVLVGALPSNPNLPTFNLDDLRLPLNLPVSIPSELVRRRPDIRASEALLHEASAQVGVAVANLYPQITLTGNYGTQTNISRDLFTSGSSIWGIGGQILQPIFNGGALIARENAAIANYEQFFAQYRQTVLQAFQNVADALRALQTDAQTLKDQADAESQAFQALTLTQDQYQLGGVSYILLLNAERQYQGARINRIQAQAARYADTAALFQALGGGWWNRTPLSGGDHVKTNCGRTSLK